MSMNLEHPFIEGRERVFVTGSFAPNGSSALVATRTDTTAFRGVGWTASYVSTGLYRVTFDGGRKYNQLDAWALGLQLASGDDKTLQLGTYVPPTATADGYVDIRCWDISGAAVADIAANANNRISFMFVFRKMDVD